jgi:hypothetical protein
MEPFTQALLNEAKSLVGGVLLGVYYDDAPADRPGRPLRAHSSHVGVDLLFEHEVVGVLSSNEYTDGTYELSLQRGQTALRRGDIEVTSLTDGLRWSELIGQQIVSSKIHWVDSPYVALTKRRKAFSSHHYDADGAVPFSGPQAPLALELHFANGGRVLFVSGSWVGDDHAIVETGSGITVLWDANTFATLVPRIAKQLKKSW